MQQPQPQQQERFVRVANWPIDIAGEPWARFVSRAMGIFWTGENLFGGMLQFRGNTGRLLDMILNVTEQRLVGALPAATALQDYYLHNGGRYVFELEFPANDGGTWRDTPGAAESRNVRSYGLVFLRVHRPRQANEPRNWQARFEAHVLVMLQRGNELSFQAFQHANGRFTRRVLLNDEYRAPVFTADHNALSDRVQAVWAILSGGGVAPYAPQFTTTSVIRLSVFAGSPFASLVQTYHLRAAVIIGRQREGQSAMLQYDEMMDQVDAYFWAAQEAIGWIPRFVMAVRGGDQIEISAFVFTLASIPYNVIRTAIVELLRVDYGFTMIDEDVARQRQRIRTRSTGARYTSISDALVLERLNGLLLRKQ